MLDWIRANAATSLWIAGASLASLVGALAVVPWLVVRIPADYFADRERPARYRSRRQPPLGWLILLMGKNMIGGLLVLTGITMLVLPGQGVLTIILGLALMNFPGKFQLERWIVSRGPTLRLINGLRRSRGRPPLVLEST